MVARQEDWNAINSMKGREEEIGFFGPNSFIINAGDRKNAASAFSSIEYLVLYLLTVNPLLVQPILSINS